MAKQKCCNACRRTSRQPWGREAGAWSSVLLIPQGIRDRQQWESLWEGDPEPVILQELSAWLRRDWHSKRQPEPPLGNSLRFGIGRWSQICCEELCYLFVVKIGSWVIGFCVFSVSSSHTQSFCSPKQIQVLAIEVVSAHGNVLQSLCF